MVVNLPGCCPRAAIGHAAAPPRSAINSRRLIPSMTFYEAKSTGSGSKNRWPCAPKDSTSGVWRQPDALRHFGRFSKRLPSFLRFCFGKLFFELVDPILQRRDARVDQSYIEERHIFGRRIKRVAVTEPGGIVNLHIRKPQVLEHARRL